MLETRNLVSAEKAWIRSVQQWNEALGEKCSEAAWRNLLGMLPENIYDVVQDIGKRSLGSEKENLNV